MRALGLETICIFPKAYDIASLKGLPSTAPTNYALLDCGLWPCTIVLFVYIKKSP
jgi:hypothetical protein